MDIIEELYDNRLGLSRKHPMHNVILCPAHGKLLVLTNFSRILMHEFVILSWNKPLIFFSNQPPRSICRYVDKYFDESELSETSKMDLLVETDRIVE